MKKIKSLVYTALMTLTLSLSSCADWLTLLPLNDVVLENYWTEKADVESVLLGAYAQLESSACIERMSIWGEMRSDNIVAGNNASTDILNITKENIMQTNSYMSWACFYDVINRANTVLEFAPLVAEKDPNYRVSELYANIAEAKAIRALSYFYLIRAYKDVPYVTIPSTDDTNEFVVPAEKFENILDSLIMDLEEVRTYAVNKYTNKKANTARFTRNGIDALLADLYLWDGDWDNCIAAVDRIVANRVEEYEEILEKEPNTTLVLFNNKYPLISNLSPGSGNLGNAYNEIFGKGNSFETLFELAFEGGSGSVENTFIRNYYADRRQSSTSIGSLKVEARVASNIGTASNVVYKSAYDGRVYESMDKDGADKGITKYVYSDVSYSIDNAGTLKSGAVNRTARGDNSASSWIIYRLTDAMLMKAEALVQKAAAIDATESELADSLNNVKTAYLQEAFDIVKIINNRAKGFDVKEVAEDALKFSAYSSSTGLMSDLVLEERRRELMYEGKRWFDLVRMTLRLGNTEKLSSLVLGKHTSNTSAISIQLKDMDAIFFPILKDELKINTLLKQNPAYEEDEFIQKN